MSKYLKAILIWITIIPIAILNGGFREYVLVKLGALAHPLSGIILSACIFVVAFFLVPKIKNCRKKDYYIFGCIWFVLTNFFDLIMYVKDGGGFSDLIHAYNFFTGNTWILVVLTTLFAPAVVMKMRNNK